MGYDETHPPISPAGAATRAREIYDRVTLAVVLTISSLVFMTAVPFLPSDTPGGKTSSAALVILVSLGIGVLAYFRRERLAVSIFWVIALLSILWQIFGMGILVFLDPRIVRLFLGFSILVASILALMFISSAPARNEPLVFACTALGVALAFTPYYYLAVPLLILSAVVTGRSSLAPLVVILLALLAPFLIAENSLRVSQEYQQEYQTVQTDLERLAAFASSYAPDTLSYMARTGRLMIMNGPVPAIDPASLIILIANRSAAYVKTAMGDVAAQSGGLVSPTILSPIFVDLLNSPVGIVMLSKLITAIVAMGVIILVAAVVGVYTPKIVGDLPVFEEYRGFIRIISPAVALILGSVVFYIILLSVSRPLMLRSDLLQNPIHAVSMIMFSGVMGGALSAREYLIQRAEAIAVARLRVSQRLDELERSIETASKDLESVKRAAPEMRLSEEEGKIEEARVFLRDARGRVNVAGLGLLRDLEERASSYAEEMQRIRGSLSNGLISSLGSLRALATRGNNQLSIIGLGSPFPEPGEVSALDPLDKILKVYLDYISSLRGSIDRLFSQYIQVIESLSRLMPREGISRPAASPLQQFDLGDRGGALDVTIELWVRLGEVYWERLRESVSEISRHLGETSRYVDPVFADKLRGISEELSRKISTGPVEIPGIEVLIYESLSICSQVLEAIRSEILYIQDLTKDIAQEAARVLRFDVLEEIGVVESLSAKIKNHDGSIESALEILRSLSSLAQSHRSSVRRDEEKIVILIAYPIARAFIEEQLASRGKISIMDLPFSPQASSIYAKIYSTSNKNVQYLEHLGVIELASREGS